MTTSAIPATTNPPAVAETEARDRVGSVVLASIDAGLALGLLLLIVVFAGAEEAEITGGALLALGASP